jgi:hypothetical protein
MTRQAVWLLLLIVWCRCSAMQPDTNAYLKEPSLRAAHLPTQVRNDIVAAIAKDFPDQPDDSPSGREIALTSWVSFVQLTQTSPAAILIRSGPDDPDNGATGNGDFWLFRRAGNHAVLILKAGGFDASPRHGVYHKGMLDLQTAWNLSCCEGGIKVYRFDGVRYQAAYCYSYTTDENGNMKSRPHRKCSD